MVGFEIEDVGVAEARDDEPVVLIAVEIGGLRVALSIERLT